MTTGLTMRVFRENMVLPVLLGVYIAPTRRVDNIKVFTCFTAIMGLDTG